MPGSLKRYITVRHEYPGFHWYEDAPDKVAFLKNRHRHMFKVKAVIEVFHDDRELEFFLVKDDLIRQILAYITMKDNLGSCEMQAEAILIGLQNLYGDNRYYQIIVSEDGENDGSVVWFPNR